MMKLMIIAALAVFGLILGSFVNALVWRLHAQADLAEHGHKKGQPTKDELSMSKGRSMCSNCHHPLAVKDLIPLFSWLFLKGKCRYCRQPIQDNPLIEAVLPVLFIVSYLSWDKPLTGETLYLFIFWLVFVTGFMALAAYDFRWYLLPDRVVFPLFGLALVMLVGRLLLFHGNLKLVLASLAAVGVASGIFYIIFIVSDGSWIGGGDVKLGLVLGVLLADPLKAVLMLFLASVLGTLVALPLLATGRAGRASRLPFGPYLLLSTFIVVLYGQPIIDAYYRFSGIS